MLIRIGRKNYYLFEKRPEIIPQLDPYHPDMWGYINKFPSEIEAMTQQLIKPKFHSFMQKDVKTGPPRPVPKPKVLTPEEAADRLASIKSRGVDTRASLLEYNKQMVKALSFSPKTLSAWLATGQSKDTWTPMTPIGVCTIASCSCSTMTHTCGITGCSNPSCAPCTTSFYGNIGV